MNTSVKLGYAMVRAETELAVMFDTKEHGTLWIPKRAIHDDSETWNMKNPDGELVVHEWFAEDRGLI
jgi:hypothetical protein